MNLRLALFAAAAVPALASAACPALLDQKVSTLQGKPDNLCRFDGQVVLVVNTASYCGFTSQYEGLEKLYQKYQGKGLVVLGFPSNDFGKQEPGTNAEVADFCERTYKVRFPMYEKTVVTGPEANPLYKGLAEKTGEAPKWNFHKYVLDRHGQPVASFGSRVTPDDPKLVAAVEKALSER
ncbi:glutathione peroxidase [Betaproteobacteria bacterium GR16-43]|nr:glutathione peroxidase [Betaproteobacteria bacterium GR16-43]